MRWASVCPYGNDLPGVLWETCSGWHKRSAFPIIPSAEVSAQTEEMVFCLYAAARLLFTTTAHCLDQVVL